MSVGQDHLPRDMYAEQALLVHSTCSIIYIGVISVITTGDTTVFLLDLCVQFTFQFPANFCTGKKKEKAHAAACKISRNKLDPAVPCACACMVKREGSLPHTLATL